MLDIALLKRIIKALNFREQLILGLTVLIRLGLVSFDLVGIFVIGSVVSLLSGTVIAPSSPFGVALSWLKKTGIENGYIIFLCLALGFFILKGLISIALNRFTANQLAKVEAAKGVQVFERILNFRLERLDRLSIQDAIFSTTHSVSSAITKSILVGSTIVGEVALLVAISVYLLITDFFLFIFIASFFGLVAWTIHRFVTKASGDAAKGIHQENLSGQGIIIGALSAFRQISLSPNKSTIIQVFSDSRASLAEYNARYQTIINLPRYITEIAVMLGIGILVGMRAVGTQNATSATVIAIFLAGIFRIVSSLLPLQSALSAWKSIQFEALPALSILELPDLNLKNSKLSRSNKKGAAQIEIRNLSYRFGEDGAWVLRDVNNYISAGEFVAIVGPSGSGKSTLVDLILGLRQPSTGEIAINGQPSRNYVLENPGSVSYVPQNPVLLSGNVRQNVSLNFGNKGLDEVAKVHSALKLAGLEAWLSSLPIAEDTILGTNGVQISGGEVQRLAIARALYTSPSFIVFDEATSSLDRDSQEKIMETLRSLAGKATILVIAHRLETLESADRVIDLS